MRAPDMDLVRGLLAELPANMQCDGYSDAQMMRCRYNVYVDLFYEFKCFVSMHDGNQPQMFESYGTIVLPERVKVAVEALGPKWAEDAAKAFEAIRFTPCAGLLACYIKQALKSING